MEKVNQWMTLLTNIGVLAGLVLLVYEVNQNTNALRNETDVAIYSMAAEDTRTIIENPDIAEVFPRAASKDWNGLSEADKFMVGNVWTSQVDRLELQYRLYQRNRTELENPVFPDAILGAKSFDGWWNTKKGDYESAFIEFFEGYKRTRANGEEK